MSFIHLQKTIKKKNWNLKIPNRIRIRYPGSGSADPDPYANEARNTAYMYIYLNMDEKLAHLAFFVLKSLESSLEIYTRMSH